MKISKISSDQILLPWQQAFALIAQEPIYEFQ